MGKLRRTDWLPVGGHEDPNEQTRRDEESASSANMSDSMWGSEDPGASANEESEEDPGASFSEGESPEEDPGASFSEQESVDEEEEEVAAEELPESADVDDQPSEEVQREAAADPAVPELEDPGSQNAGGDEGQL
eukprot:8068561-Karenia_brevis.AAC.1